MDNLTIRWVKAHLGDSILHRGNFFADQTAKEAAQGIDIESVDPLEIPLKSLAAIKTAIHPYFIKEWDRRWLHNLLGTPAKCLATKDWFPKVNPKRSFELLSNRSRYEYSILVHAITGHNHLAYHEHKQDNSKDPTCYLCKKPGSLMTSRHIFTNCDALALQRHHYLGHHSPIAPFTFSVNQAIRFLRVTNIGWLPSDEVVD